MAGEERYTVLPKHKEVTPTHPEYPQLLLATSFPEQYVVGDRKTVFVSSAPQMLYVDGRIDNTDRFPVAIIGPVDGSEVSQAMAYRFGTRLAEMGHQHIGRLNPGVDQAGHYGTVFSNGRSLGFLPRGLDHIYPPESHQLAFQVMMHGALITEETDALLTPQRFRERDRLIVGTAGLIVITDIVFGSNEHMLAKLAHVCGKNIAVLAPDMQPAGSNTTFIRQISQLSGVSVIGHEDHLQELIEMIQLQ